jgi:hypothetical protein
MIGTAASAIWPCCIANVTAASRAGPAAASCAWFVCHKLIAKKREDRYQTAQEVIAALSSHRRENPICSLISMPRVVRYVASTLKAKRVAA